MEVIMKKTTLLLVIMTLLVLLSGCSSTTQPNIPVNDTLSNEQAKSILIGKVIKIYDNYMLVANAEDDAKSSDIYTVSTDFDFDASKIKPGSIVKIGYDGMIMETYPAKLGDIKYINFIEQKDDLVGLYEKVFDKLWETDKGLNTDIDILAFDLSKTTNLTDAEKSALIYVLGNKYSLETVSGTFDQLSKDGYIDKEKLYFENGILFSFEVTKESKNSFMFNAQKWRSGLGAYFFQDCTAKKTKDGWDYKIGEEMIS